MLERGRVAQPHSRCPVRVFAESEVRAKDSEGESVHPNGLQADGTVASDHSDGGTTMAMGAGEERVDPWGVSTVSSRHHSQIANLKLWVL